MIRPIVLLGDPVLRIPAQVLDAHDSHGEAVRALVRDMTETLERAGGVGLAAPQVGAAVRLILAGSFPTDRAPDRPLVPISTFLNPRIVAASPETEEAWEGCLSFQAYQVCVVRPQAVTVEYITLDGSPARVEAEGFFARVLQHEIDHLDGILTLDRAAGPEDIQASSPGEPPTPSSPSDLEADLS